MRAVRIYSEGKVLVANLKPGDSAPDFALPDQNGNTVHLSDLRGRPVCVFFFPKALTSGCTTQATMLRDLQKEDLACGLQVIGISQDKPELQNQFDNKHDLGYPLLSDPDHQTADAYGAWGVKMMYGQKKEGIIRSAFLVDEQGRIEKTWYHVPPKDNAPLLLEVLKNRVWR